MNNSKENRNIKADLCKNFSNSEKICFCIYNNGPKIPENILNRIFEKGFTTRPNGHGHGLYISRLIAEALGGHIYALSGTELPSEWSVGFQIDLPVVSHRELDLIGERRSGAV